MVSGGAAKSGSVLVLDSLQAREMSMQHVWGSVVTTVDSFTFPGPSN